MAEADKPTTDEEKEERLKKIFEMGGWSTGGAPQLNQDAEKYFWEYNAMNGTVVFSDGEKMWWRKDVDDGADKELEQQGMQYNMDMFCPTPEIVFDIMQVHN